MMNTAAVEKHMTKYPVLAYPDMKSQEALALMKTFRIRHLPVVEDDEILGVVSKRDLFRVASIDANEEKTVAEAMTRNPYIVRPGTPLSDVARKMADERYGSAVVMSTSGDVLGIFTTTDALKMLAKYLVQEERDYRTEWFEWDMSVGE